MPASEQRTKERKNRTMQCTSPFIQLCRLFLSRMKWFDFLLQVNWRWQRRKEKKRTIASKSWSATCVSFHRKIFRIMQCESSHRAYGPCSFGTIRHQPRSNTMTARHKGDNTLHPCLSETMSLSRHPFIHLGKLATKGVHARRVDAGHALRRASVRMREMMGW